MPRTSCGLPGLKDGPSSPPCGGPLFGLASDGVCQAPVSPRDRWALTPPFHPYPALRRGGVFSVALSLGLPPVPVRDHPALRCPDFPRGHTPPATTHLPPHLLDLGDEPARRPVQTILYANNVRDSQTDYPGGFRGGPAPARPPAWLCRLQPCCVPSVCTVRARWSGSWRGPSPP